MSSNWIPLNNKVIIVTGGAAGIGAEIVNNLLANQAKVAIIDINQPPSEHNQNYYSNNQLVFFKCDITKRSEAEQTINKIMSHFGYIDVLINNAGVNRPNLLVDYYNHDKKHEISDEEFDFMINVNQKAVFICSQIVARHMVQQKSGVIINIASEAGIEGSTGQSCYAATKAAVHAFTLSWAKELGKFNIRVVGVAPGINEPTPMVNPKHKEMLAYTRGLQASDISDDYATKIPLGRPGRLNELADLVSFLASDHSSYITGTTINITGGKSHG